MSTAKRIGGDWVENVDASSGKTYYANLKTKVTTWTYPAELKGEPVDDSPVNWVERQDPKSGRMYYYNPKTKETTWQKPAGVVAAAASTLGDDQNWVERQDPKTGRTFFYNPMSGKTSWTNPNTDDSDVVDEGEDLQNTQPVFTPTSPLQTVSKARQSIKLGAATPRKVIKRHSSEGIDEDGEDEVTQPEDLGTSSMNTKPSAGADRFAKLRALKEKREGKSATEESVVGSNISGAVMEEVEEEDVQEKPEVIDLIPEFSNGIPYHNFEDYVKANYNLKRKGFMGKKTTISKIMNWKKDVIRTALHNLNDQSLNADAVQIFKNIVSYMGDRESSKQGTGHCEKILGLTLNAPEGLRDELYCQLVKQTRNNPKANSCVRGWQLMAICAGTFPPSKKLEPYLLSYCDENTSTTPIDEKMNIHPEVPPYAKYVLLRLQKSIQLGPRREIPTELEIVSAKERQPLVQRVHLLDRHYKTVPVEAWTTVGELNAMVARKLEIKDPTPFATFEVCSNDEERVLDEDERVLDVVAYWKKEYDRAKVKKKAPTFTFVYKMRLFFDIPDSDHAAINLAYMQAVHDVTDSRYPCADEDAITLAALQAQEKHGDYQEGHSAFDGLLHEFLPKRFLNPDKEEDLINSINKIYKKLQGYTSDEAKHNYLDFVKTWSIYGSTYFYVDPQNVKEFPAVIVLAVNARSILAVDPVTYQILRTYPYSEVVTWGHSLQTFVLVIGNLIRQTKYYFKTDQGTDINALVHAYVNKIVEN